MEDTPEVQRQSIRNSDANPRSRETWHRARPKNKLCSSNCPGSSKPCGVRSPSCQQAWGANSNFSPAAKHPFRTPGPAHAPPARRGWHRCLLVQIASCAFEGSRPSNTQALHATLPRFREVGFVRVQFQSVSQRPNQDFCTFRRPSPNAPPGVP